MQNEWQNSPINADAVKDWTITPEGYLRFDVPLARPGVMVYDKKKGDSFTAREYRSEAELFNQDSINTLIGKPVTVSHPKGGVNSRNYKAVTAGLVTAAWREGSDLMATFEIRDERSIKLIQQDKRLRGVSAGYFAARKINRDGIAPEDGERFDTIDEGLGYNHASVVRNPRVKTARFNLDGETMELDEALETIASLEKDKAKLTGELSTARGDLLKANQKLLNMDSANGEAYQRGVADGKRENVLLAAAKTMGINADGLDDIKLVKQAIVKKVNPDMNLDGLPDESLDVAVDMALVTAKQKFTQTPPKRPRGQINNDGNDDDVTNNKKQFSDYQARLMGGHKAPGSEK